LSYAKVNMTFGANGKVKWGILLNSPHDSAQLVEEREAGGGGNSDWEKTQLVQECLEEERVNDSGDEADATIDWGMTQRVEDTDEEVGDDDLSEGTQVQSDDEGLQNDERGVEEHDDVADSDASTDEEGATGQLPMAKCAFSDSHSSALFLYLANFSDFIFF
jgi:hypothetical protein